MKMLQRLIMAAAVLLMMQVPCWAGELRPSIVPPGESKNLTLGANSSPERELSSTIEPNNLPKMITGDLLRAEGNYYVVREPGGHEVKFHIDRDTKLSGSPRIGDHLEAEVTAAGHARSVERR